MKTSRSSKCHVCGSQDLESPLLDCKICRQNYCDDCSAQCDVGEPSHKTCKNCHASYFCSVCYLSFCNDHSNGTCTECGRTTCSFDKTFECECCSHEVADCCGTQCDNCGARVDGPCYSKCDKCGKDTCSDCLTQCYTCDKPYLCICGHHECIATEHPN